MEEAAFIMEHVEIGAATRIQRRNFFCREAYPTSGLRASLQPVLHGWDVFFTIVLRFEVQT